MKTSLRLIACAFVLFGALGMPGLAQQKGPHEAEFRTFYADLMKAVQANDKEKIADMIAYPVSSWSIQTKGNFQEGSIKDKADFLARFNVLFTNYMRLHLPKAKVQSTPELWYTSWRDGNSECLFQFKYFEGTGFKIVTYDVGPYYLSRTWTLGLVVEAQSPLAGTGISEPAIGVCFFFSAPANLSTT